jgi:subtilisin family serine protease
MSSDKIDNQLNLALNTSNEQREKTLDLEVGFEPKGQLWEVIVRYVGSLDKIKQELSATVTVLMNGYAILTLSESNLNQLSEYEEIIFIEKPKRLFFSVNQGEAVSCILPVKRPPYTLTGKGVLVGVVDSGIDYTHPDFRGEDGTTRILALWDQTVSGKPPLGYTTGTVYSKEEIDKALLTKTREESLKLVPSVDLSGHGTHVAGILCGNGRASKGQYQGVATESELLIVKLGNVEGNSFPKTTRLMEAVNWLIMEAVQRGKPIAINLSFGNSYGSHSGRSLLETYLNDMAAVWKTVICIGTGNEGGSGRHSHGNVKETTKVEFSVAEGTSTINLQLWKNFYDIFSIELVSPDGSKSGRISAKAGASRFSLEQTDILLYYGEPLPYNLLQELYFEFIPKGERMNSGIWTILFYPEKIVEGQFDLWLPAGGLTPADTRFLRPSEETTLTIPSTAELGISVGAYDGRTNSYASFSGRGYTRENRVVKPDLVAPGVGILSTAPGGGYTIKSGTSMATPFVTGGAALMMEWGIVKGNDRYLYGEKLKAYLHKGARALPEFTEYPNPEVGYGALCLEKSIL